MPLAQGDEGAPLLDVVRKALEDLLAVMPVSPWASSSAMARWEAAVALAAASERAIRSRAIR
jgi:hypothetical protein